DVSRGGLPLPSTDFPATDVLDSGRAAPFSHHYSCLARNQAGRGSSVPADLLVTAVRSAAARVRRRLRDAPLGQTIPARELKASALPPLRSLLAPPSRTRRSSGWALRRQIASAVTTRPALRGR